jgi:mRNA interferase MazF
VTRGEVYRVRLPPKRGHEQAGPRYAVIVQADELLALSTAIVAPTSRSAAPATFRPEITLDGQTTRVLVEQVRAVDLQRLGEVAGRLSLSEQLALDDALRTVLGLA